MRSDLVLRLLTLDRPEHRRVLLLRVEEVEGLEQHTNGTVILMKSGRRINVAAAVDELAKLIGWPTVASAVVRDTAVLGRAS